MADAIDVDGMPISDEEKKILIKALTDKKFRDELLQHAEGGVELSDDELDRVVGGAGLPVAMTGAQVNNLVNMVRQLDLRIGANAEILCTRWTGAVGDA